MAALISGVTSIAAVSMLGEGEGEGSAGAGRGVFSRGVSVGVVDASSISLSLGGGSNSGELDGVGLRTVRSMLSSSSCSSWGCCGGRGCGVSISISISPGAAMGVDGMRFMSAADLPRRVDVLSVSSPPILNESS